MQRGLSLNGYGTGPEGGASNCGAVQIFQGYRKLFYVDLFYCDSGAPYDLTGAQQVTAAFPGVGGTAPVVEVLTPPTILQVVTTVNLSNVLATAAPVVFITLGMQITGAGIPVGATVTAVAPGAITISAAATASATITATLNTGMSVSTTGTTATSSNQLTGLASAAGVLVGQVITAVGVPTGTTVTGVSGTAVTMSANATASASVALAFALPPQVSVVGAAGAGRLSIAVPAADAALLQVNPNPLQNQDLQISVTNADGTVTAFVLADVLNIMTLAYGVNP